MPNHVTNVMTVTGPDKDRAAFLAAHFTVDPDRPGDGPQFDFSTIIPRPSGYDEIVEGSQLHDGVYALTGEFRHFCPLSSPRLRDAGIKTREEFKEWLAANHPDAIAMAERALVLRDKHGALSWYDWSIAHWGTKWNAYQTTVTEDARSVRVNFDTAWSVPEPVLDALSARYPALTFALVAFDEGWNFAFEGRWRAGVNRGPGSMPASATLYEAVYGHAPERDDESEEG